MRRASTAGVVALVVLLALLSGCSRTTAPPDVRVNAGSQTVTVHPTQYCQGDSVERYQVTPPIIQVDPNTTITLTVPDAVARQGWSVQVWDEKLKSQLGEVGVGAGKAVSQINSSDAVPPAYYLVVVEKKVAACHFVSGAWPVGFIRADSGGSSPTSGASGTATPTAP